MAAAEYEQSQSTVDDLLSVETAKRLEQYPGPWTTVARHGQAGHELLAEADDIDADLLVVGHRSHGLLRDALLGSVASGAVHHSRRSILVAIPPPTTPESTLALPVTDENSSTRNLRPRMTDRTPATAGVDASLAAQAETSAVVDDPDRG